MRRDAHPTGLYDTFAQVLTSLWERGTTVTT